RRQRLRAGHVHGDDARRFVVEVERPRQRVLVTATNRDTTAELLGVDHDRRTAPDRAAYGPGEVDGRGTRPGRHDGLDGARDEDSEPAAMRTEGLCDEDEVTAHRLPDAETGSASARRRVGDLPGDEAPADLANRGVG